MPLQAARYASILQRKNIFQRVRAVFGIAVGDAITLGLQD
tara:strand:+ start:230 stop:349 length:120 start_codon:yes stop_codon:yes gene_type:complete